jgi:AcrR family transcriptional regulator
LEIGLRERKKLKTKASIQREAMRLFLEKGFDETTVEDIAEAVEISPSTFFNYFPSKEDVVFEDELDPLVLEAFDAQPPDTNPVRRLRMAMRAVFGNLTPEQDRMMRDRIRLMSTNPELRGAMLSQFAGIVDQIAHLLGPRVGRKRDDFLVHNIAGAVLGVLLSAMLEITDKPKAEMLRVVDAALAHLEAGLPLDWKPDRRR